MTEAAIDSHVGKSVRGQRSSPGIKPRDEAVGIGAGRPHPAMRLLATVVAPLVNPARAHWADRARSGARDRGRDLAMDGPGFTQMAQRYLPAMIGSSAEYSSTPDWTRP